MCSLYGNIIIIIIRMCVAGIRTVKDHSHSITNSRRGKHKNGVYIQCCQCQGSIMSACQTVRTVGMLCHNMKPNGSAFLMKKVFCDWFTRKPELSVLKLPQFFKSHLYFFLWAAVGCAWGAVDSLHVLYDAGIPGR